LKDDLPLPVSSWNGVIQVIDMRSIKRSHQVIEAKGVNLFAILIGYEEVFNDPEEPFNTNGDMKFLLHLSFKGLFRRFEQFNPPARKCPHPDMGFPLKQDTVFIEYDCRSTATEAPIAGLKSGHWLSSIGSSSGTICKNHLKSIVDYYVKVYGDDGLDAKSILRLSRQGITPQR